MQLPPGTMPPPTMQPGMVPALPQFQAPAITEPSFEQLRLQQEAYQFWVQQQLNAQMALFESAGWQQAELQRAANAQAPTADQARTAAPKKPSTQARLPGDWTCHSCGDHQFARNRTCRSCGSMRPADSY